MLIKLWLYIVYCSINVLNCPGSVVTVLLEYIDACISSNKAFMLHLVLIVGLYLSRKLANERNMDTCTYSEEGDSNEDKCTNLCIKRYIIALVTLTPLNQR